MKVMLYISTISNGGAARVMSNLANDLSQKGHDCILVTTFRKKEEYQLNSMVKRVSLYEHKPQGLWLMTNIGIIKKLRDNLKKEKPDILLSFLAEPNFRASIATIGMDVKTIVSVRNDPEREYHGVFRTLLANLLFRRVNGIVFQTKDARNWFPMNIRKKGTVIYNSVKDIFYEVDLPSEKDGIVATGRLAKQKNHILLIEAYSIIYKEISDDLYIYGAGDSSSLKKFAEKKGVGDRVHFLGQTMDVINAIKGAKLYVMSSDYEGMPNALMEAMAMGLPCISTDCPCGGPKSLFLNRMYKYLVPVGDSKALASKMLELITNDESRNRHALDCKSAAQLFRPEIINKQWVDYFMSIK